MHIPDETAFITGFLENDETRPVYADFLPDKDLDSMAREIITARLPALIDEHDPVIDYRWKRRGGTSGGSTVMGKCVKLSGPAKHYSDADFLIWIARDHCEFEGFGRDQIEALLYHELLHVVREETLDKDDNLVVKYRTRAHDAELFYDELRAYGAWHRGHEVLVEVVRQLALPMEAV